MRGPFRSALFICASLLVVPAAVHAQASITGVVKDSSGAILPGVVVEASSPALLEKVRSVVTDGTGQYRIETLRPGTYTVTFTLPGFSPVRREGLELAGTFTAVVNAELRVGSLEETITVAGGTALVDVQNTRRQSVMTTEDIDVVPSGRHPVYLAALNPPVSTGTQDVGGVRGAGRQDGAISMHGNTDVRTQVNGVSMHTSPGNGGTGVSILRRSRK